MQKKCSVRVAAFVLLFVGLTAGAYAQITIRGGLALSNVDVKGQGQTYEGDVGIGANVCLDYLLHTNIPLSLGGELGVDSASFSMASGKKDTVTAIPILARIAYHFNVPNPKLDLYLLGKLGYVFGTWKGDMKDSYGSVPGVSIDNPGGFGFGLDLGAAWYFTPTVGAFAEVGFDRYSLSTDVTYNGAKAATVDAPFTRFLTAGVSVKL